jgi:hypothetical protein
MSLRGKLASLIAQRPVRGLVLGRLRAKLAAIFAADPGNFKLFIAELGLKRGAATKFMEGAQDALTPDQRAAALRFAESFGHDMETNRLVRPGLRSAPRRHESAEAEPDGSVYFIDLWGNGRRERDNLRWHERRGASTASVPTTYISMPRPRTGVAFTAPSDANGLAP